MDNLARGYNWMIVPIMHPIPRSPKAKKAIIGAIVKPASHRFPENRAGNRHHNHNKDKLGQAFQFTAHCVTAERTNSRLANVQSMAKTINTRTLCPIPRAKGLRRVFAAAR